MMETIDGKLYEVTRTLIDLDALKEEKKELEEAVEPTEKELLEHGRAYHPYFMERPEDREARIAEIDLILKEVK